MRTLFSVCFFCLILPCSAQPGPSGPSDSHAQKTFAEAKQLFNRHQYAFALDGFRKADKQDGGRCVPCENLAYEAALLGGNYKAAQEQALTLLNNATDAKNKAKAILLQGGASLREGQERNRQKSFQEADRFFKAALEVQPQCQDALYLDGMALAHLQQDEAAQAQFRSYLKGADPKDVDYQRAQRYAIRPELARARMAPPFRIKTLTGQSLSMDDLAGKVVLIDFWATWCPPCVASIPHVREIAKHFAGPNFAILSVSLDFDENKWKAFVAKNNMMWPQYRDSSLHGEMSTLFRIQAIPQAFVIDEDGVLQGQQVGDPSFEGKLKKLITHAEQRHTINSQEALPAAKQ